jgi:hypothetical protein
MKESQISDNLKVLYHHHVCNSYDFKNKYFIYSFYVHYFVQETPNYKGHCR